MTIKNIQILEDKRLFPTVMNIIEGSNKVDTAVYTMENYIVGETDLSKYDWYVDLIGVGGLDEVKLTKVIKDEKLVITFDLTEYVTRVGNVLTYQLVAKDTVGSVWNSAKGIILNSDSIQADDFVVANYPSILRQWENRIEDLAGNLDNAYVLIPYDETIPVEDRIAGKFYLQRLNDVDYSCVIEDAEGHVITDGNVVHKTGEEDIFDLKKFRKPQIKNDNVVYNETPATTQSFGLSAVDKNNGEFGNYRFVKYNNGNNVAEINVRGNDGSFSSLSLIREPNGTTYVNCPTPAANATGNKVATVSWVNNKTQPATQTTYGLMRVAAPVDETDCSCNDASITPSNLYDLANYRIANTQYEVDDVVGCPYHANLMLKCTTAGYTSGDALDTSGTLNVGDTITDGSVVWQVEKIGGAGGTGRNIGDIFYTTRTDTELNGAIECNGATFNTSDFSGSESIGNLLSGGKVPYVSLTEYQTAIDTNGSCRAFGWDGGDSFRVPTLNDVYIEAGTALTAGEFINESLPDHKHTATSATAGALKVQGGSQYVAATGATITTNYASELNPIYQDGAKVKPDSVRYRAMVQLANEATDEALITATSALQQIANKVDKSDMQVVSELPAAPVEGVYYFVKE